MKDEELRPVIRLMNEWKIRGKNERELSRLIDPDNKKHEDFLLLKRTLEISGVVFIECALNLNEAINKIRASG